MRKSIILVTIGAVGLASVPAAQAEGCCAGGVTQGGCSTAANMSASTLAAHATTKTSLPQTIQAVFDGYISVQSALADDSFQRTQKAAQTLAKASRNGGNFFSTKLLQQAEALANASDMPSARVLFKPVSDSLIAYVKHQKMPPGVYREAYCPMANASWLQTGESISNPYMGKKMLRCGEFKS